MKKIIVGVLCSGMLFTGLIGSSQASASEVNNNINDTSEITLDSNTSPQARLGVIHGKVYHFFVSTGKRRPPVKWGTAYLVYVRNDNGRYFGFYRY